MTSVEEGQEDPADENPFIRDKGGGSRLARVDELAGSPVPGEMGPHARRKKGAPQNRRLKAKPTLFFFAVKK